MKRKNGFTLIELLAIIVILAIIAVITVPIILNIIDESSKGAAKDSAHGYTKALSQYFASTLLEDKDQEFPSGVYHIVSDGTLDNGTEPIPVNISGKQPSEGWIQLKKGIVTLYSLKFDDYVVTKMNDENTIVEKQNHFTPILTTEVSEREPTDNNKIRVTVFTEWTVPKEAQNITGGSAVSLVEVGAAEPTKETIYSSGTKSQSTGHAMHVTHRFYASMSQTTAAKRLFAISFLTYTLDGEEYTILSDVKISEPE